MIDEVMVANPWENVLDGWTVPFGVVQGRYAETPVVLRVMRGLLLELNTTNQFSTRFLLTPPDQADWLVDVATSPDAPLRWAPLPQWGHNTSWPEVPSPETLIVVAGLNTVMWPDFIQWRENRPTLVAITAGELLPHNAAPRVLSVTHRYRRTW